MYLFKNTTFAYHFAFSAPGRNWCWEWSPPNAIRQYFIASVTRLYVSALIMQLHSEGQINLESPAVHYLGSSVMAGIHILRGIADYFEQRRHDGSTRIGKAMQHDF